MLFRVSRGFLCALLVIMLAPHSVLGEPELTDEQKRDIVYEMYGRYRKDFRGVREILPREAMKMLNEGRIIFLDTRRPAEMAVSRLPNAISKEDFLKDPLKYRDMTVAAYCTITYRSGKFAMEMAEKGIDIRNLEGGLLAWVLEGGKVYDSQGETKRIHVYGEEWDYPPKGYRSVKFGFFDKLF